MLEGFRNALSCMEGADEPILGPDLRMNLRDAIGWGRQKVGMAPLEHGEVVQVIPCGKGLLRADAQPLRDFTQRSSFVVVHMAEACIDIVPDDCEIRNGCAISLQPRMHDVHVGI